MSVICIWGASLNKVDDEAQIVAGVSLLRRRFPSCRFIFISQYGNRLTRFLQTEGVEAEVVGTRFKVISALRRASVLLVMGGVTFETPAQAMRALTLVAAARAVGCPVIGWQLSLFPYLTWWAPVIYRPVFSMMEHLSVREAVSLDTLARLKVRSPSQLAADSRFTLEPNSRESIRLLLNNEGLDPDAPLIAMTTRHLHRNIPVWVKATHQYSDEIAERSYKVLAEVVEHLSQLAQVVLIPMHPDYNDDLATCARLGSTLTDPKRLTILRRRYSTREIMGIIRHCDLLFASRLGSVVMAITSETPIVAVAYESRVRETMERVGLGEMVLDWRRLDTAAMVAAIDRIWMGQNAVIDSAKVSALKCAAEASADELARFLSDKEIEKPCESRI